MSSSTTPLLGGSNRRVHINRVANPSFLWKSGAILTAFGIITGAFGTHALRSTLEAPQLAAWQTASHYAIYNGIGLLAISQHSHYGRHKFAGPAILAGAIVFCGSIITMVLTAGKTRFLGPVTPIGGALMIMGYVSLCF